MKNRTFRKLQMFAESVDTESSQTDPTNPETEKTEPANQGEKNPGVKYSDEDVESLISKKFSEWEKKQQKKADEATKLADMNAQEKVEYEKEQLEKELEEYRRKEVLLKMSSTARKMLAESDIAVSDELLAMMVSADAEQTKSAVESFVKLFSDAVEQGVKERLKGKTPTKGARKATMTKEQIMEIKDPELRQQKMLENRELFDF